MEIIQKLKARNSTFDGLNNRDEVIRLADIFEVNILIGKAYLYYKYSKIGDLVRVLPGLHFERQPSLINWSVLRKNI